MDDDWGLHAVVRGCSAAVSGSGAAATATTTTTRSSPTSFVSDFDFQSLNNNNSSFLFSSSSFGSNSNNGESVVGSGQLFSLPSDPIAMRPQRKNTNNHSNHRVFVDELYKPFSVPKPEANNSFSFCIASSQATTNTTIIPNTIISSFSSSSNDHQMMRPLQPLKQVLNNNNNNSSSTNKHSHAGSVSSSTAPRSKKRKNQMKKVCQVPAESLSSDIWAWRKYGQKPIKGSPYPRGYYRCSSSKGCLARKQVERNRSDPAMFIVTYTSEHNHPAPTHRNSLAGSTRQKPSLPASSAAAAKPSSPATSPEEDLAAALSGSATESKDGPESSTLLMEDEEDDEFGLSDMAVSDDFFVGLEGLGAPAAGDYISDNFPASFGLPLSASSAATAAGGS